MCGRTPPCHKCPQRSEVCHADCVAYREWADTRRAQREARWQRSQGGRQADNMLMDSRIKLKKRKER